ncbi:BTB/POZ domain-containing protein At3g05675-like isoform X3 [Malus sylvestris]|uniref:BTB/POZ domain-containing protein At3g05675-like isoform X2 n=1 Tax=Malus domestica TaxID=3750 RepID=UPI000499150A|nr:BTB/POZ domain-containing protein At3g05675-like isoform X2 [Malus domestica]XP_050123537.1 BTB/POZ domain-containing protein At3g05675-like isoform X3 [Malus sylvestris]
MEYLGSETSTPSQIGDRSTSDVVVRIRTEDGRDDRLYCHSQILIEKSKYFADRLSENWPTCQILDSRNCVDVYCQESEFDHHVAVKLGCPQIITACVNYLEAVPWEESEEEEILKIIPRLGSQVEPILARLLPVNHSSIMAIFLSTIRFATSSPLPIMNDLKSSAQEQLEYMLTEDDDAPLLTADDEIKSEVKECVKRLYGRFNNLLEALLSEVELSSDGGKMQSFQRLLSDLSWACQILTKLEIMRELVCNWMDASDKIVKAVKQARPTTELIETKLRVVEVAAKILEAIGYGTVILPTAKRLHMVKVWLPFVRVAKPVIDSATTTGDDAPTLKMDSELWQSLESTFVSIILALPSVEQAEILTEWLENEHIQYPDLTEAFEVWCYRSKVSKRRLSFISVNHDKIDTH